MRSVPPKTSWKMLHTRQNRRAFHSCLVRGGSSAFACSDAQVPWGKEFPFDQISFEYSTKTRRSGLSGGHIGSGSELP